MGFSYQMQQFQEDRMYCALVMLNCPCHGQAGSLTELAVEGTFIASAGGGAGAGRKGWQRVEYRSGRTAVPCAANS
jgi:hypothetical protein